MFFFIVVVINIWIFLSTRLCNLCFLRNILRKIPRTAIVYTNQWTLDGIFSNPFFYRNIFSFKCTYITIHSWINIRPHDPLIIRLIFIRPSWQSLTQQKIVGRLSFSFPLLGWQKSIHTLFCWQIQQTVELFTTFTRQREAANGSHWGQFQDKEIWENKIQN